MYLTKEETALGIEQVYSILRNAGVIFEDPDAVEHLVKCGAKADGPKVFFTREMIETALSRFEHYELPAESEKKIYAANPFGNAPRCWRTEPFAVPSSKMW